MAFDSSAPTYDTDAPLGQGESFIADKYFTAPSESYSALKRQSLRLERLLQVMPAGVIVIDGKGVVRQANTLAKELLGEPLEKQIWRHIISRSFRPRADDGHEVSLHDGRRVKLSITPLIDEPGQLIVITDLTETRELQARVSHMQRLSSLGKMVASLAHQIRTPLSAAMLYASNLTSSRVDPATRDKFTHRIVNRLRDLESQVNDMLLFAKSGDEQVVSAVRLGSLLSAVQQGSDALLQQSGVELISNIDEAADSACILANESALNGALVNLIHNAVQVTSRGGSLYLTASQHADNVVIRIRDTGPGIAVEHQNKVFEPFFTTKTNGTGLGLAVVQSAVNAHKGTVSVANHPQGGAEFVISLPLHVSQTERMQQETTPLMNNVTEFPDE
ncbi:sensor histidine kinase [Alteromonas oceanisediminis]|uniref:sensor histidine kinase n=1 Tax=Alteromonas oceanisediminis TaxID=2836180 RepID=UPI001BD9E50E|nr:ATP-binding protein [Alteromonas oceanisediminis]MBT0584925.1 PAS domain-containing protein [Alteromonas oceanisediminis]